MKPPTPPPPLTDTAHWTKVYTHAEQSSLWAADYAERHGLDPSPHLQLADRWRQRKEEFASGMAPEANANGQCTRTGDADEQ